MKRNGKRLFERGKQINFLAKNKCMWMLKDGTVHYGVRVCNGNMYRHPYIIFNPTQSNEECLYESAEDSPDAWVVAYKTVPETRPYLEKMVGLLYYFWGQRNYATRRALKDVSPAMYRLASYISCIPDVWVQEICGGAIEEWTEDSYYDFVEAMRTANDIFNQAILRFRVDGLYRTEGEIGGLAFRVSSVGYDWTEQVQVYCMEHKVSGRIYASRDWQSDLARTHSPKIELLPIEWFEEITRRLAKKEGVPYKEGMGIPVEDFLGLGSSLPKSLFKSGLIESKSKKRDISLRESIYRESLANGASPTKLKNCYHKYYRRLLREANKYGRM